MNRRRWLLPAVLAALVALALFSLPALSHTPLDAPAAARLKQVAAPPGDFISGQLNLPDPARAGIRSQWAMLPVNLQPAADGMWTWQQSVPIENAQEVALLVLSPDRSAWSVRLTPPDQTELDLQAADRLSGVERAVGQLGEGQAQITGDVYTLSGYAPGAWIISVTSNRAPIDRSSPAGYLLVTDRQSSYRLYSHLSNYELLAGNEVGLVTTVYDDRVATADGVPATARDVKVEAELQVQYPDGQQVTLPLADDGAHADGAAGDGVWGALLKLRLSGEYTARLIVRGQTPDGQTFLRTSEHIFPVSDPVLTLRGAAAAETVDATTLRLPLHAELTGKLPAHLQVAAEVWGTDAKGAAVPVVWISGMVAPQAAADGQVMLSLNLDARWITLAQAAAPFELRQVRVQDPDTHIPLARLDAAPVQLPALSRQARRAITQPTSDMLMGARPAPTGHPLAAYVGGRKLLLVHGYCSGGNPWPTADFSNYAVFLDANQNRSHDQFAQQVRNFGAQYDSFGAVAHSQGGAALLHLYTYYWSGLDYSSGSRLIQSVGTPYQGTALAGNLALLGQIFGVGCGSNWDLTYDGAALWLSGIPQWARSRVYYSTTSFTDVWWRYDYCNIASDVLLSDPDDGVIERWAGQLSGANNRGHKTGWCHTTGMRDTAQYDDHGRNSEMNTYANR